MSDTPSQPPLDRQPMPAMREIRVGDRPLPRPPQLLPSGRTDLRLRPDLCGREEVCAQAERVAALVLELRRERLVLGRMLAGLQE